MSQRQDGLQEKETTLLDESYWLKPLTFVNSLLCCLNYCRNTFGLPCPHLPLFLVSTSQVLPGKAGTAGLTCGVQCPSYNLRIIKDGTTHSKVSNWKDPKCYKCLKKMDLPQVKTVRDNGLVIQTKNGDGFAHLDGALKRDGKEVCTPDHTRSLTFCIHGYVWKCWV